MSALLSFTRFTDYGSYFSLPLPFSVYLGVAVATLGILLCVFIGATKFVRRHCCGGRLTLSKDEFSSSRKIIDSDVEMGAVDRQSTRRHPRGKSSRLPDNGIQEEPSSHGYAAIDDLDESLDDYIDVNKALPDSDSDDYDYENLRGGV